MEIKGDSYHSKTNSTESLSSQGRRRYLSVVSARLQGRTASAPIKTISELKKATGSVSQKSIREPRKNSHNIRDKFEGRMEVRVG